MKSSIKKILVIALVALVAMSAFKYSYGTQTPSALITAMDTDTTTAAKSRVDKVMQSIVVIARIVGVCVALAMLIVIGMKYMTAAPSEKADIKKSAVVYVVGALLLFGVVGVLGILSDFSKVITASS